MADLSFSPEQRPAAARLPQRALYSAGGAHLRVPGAYTANRISRRSQPQPRCSSFALPPRDLAYRGGPCQRDRILDRISDPIFGSYPATLFSQQRAYKLANVSHTLVSKVETIAVCERERVAHVCCAALSSWCPCVFCSPRRKKIAVHDLPKLQPQAMSVQHTVLRVVSVW